jgi:ElaB/YqjD/DUF883 family membrane-anchored ribosome-binding protein
MCWPATLKISGLYGDRIMAATKQNLQLLLDEFGALTADVTRLMEAPDQQGADELKKRVSEARAKLENVVTDMSSHDAIHELGENIADIVKSSAQQRPMATLALAVGLGFILGAAVRR